MLRAFTRLLVPPYQPKRGPSKKVAIVIPLSSRPGLNADEEVSLRHLYHYLGHYDRFFLAPKGLPLPFPEKEVKRFSRKYFGSVGAHARLLYWPGFYEAFADYEFIFFYHLDALVFSDRLGEWLDTDIDYIGPPWINCAATPWVTRPRVGNAGFALLRVRAALEVLHNRYRMQPATFWLEKFTHNGDRLRPLYRILEVLSRRWPRSKLINLPLQDWKQLQDPSPHNRNTDVFWSDHAVRFLPSFKVASFEQGLEFGFEADPEKCLELNGGRMPFGCHAWGRYDRKFWEPFLLPRSAATAAR